MQNFLVQVDAYYRDFVPPDGKDKTRQKYEESWCLKKALSFAGRRSRDSRQQTPRAAWNFTLGF